uniref:Uncharacterized protein n=1 Tax=Anguilla anguilla TaxID=7936 RepID=A0A0E9PAC6_ANGAN
MVHYRSTFNQACTNGEARRVSDCKTFFALMTQVPLLGNYYYVYIFIAVFQNQMITISDQ